MPSALAGAFANSGGGLPPTKAEKREKAEVAELAAFDAAPVWSSPNLLAELRARAAADGVAPVLLTEFDINATLLQATTIAKLEADGKAKGKAAKTEPVGAWWAVRAAATAAADADACILCLGQDKDARLRAAVAWWPLAKLAAPLRVQPERGEQPRGVTGRGPLPEAEQEGVGRERRRAERERERLHSEGEQHARSAAHHPRPLLRLGDRAQAPWLGFGLGLGLGLG